MLNSEEKNNEIKFRKRTVINTFNNTRSYPIRKICHYGQLAKHESQKSKNLMFLINYFFITYPSNFFTKKKYNFQKFINSNMLPLVEVPHPFSTFQFTNKIQVSFYYSINRHVNEKKKTTYIQFLVIMTSARKKRK